MSIKSTGALDGEPAGFDCRKCGTEMVITDSGLVTEIVRCPTEDCPCEGVRGLGHKALTKIRAVIGGDRR